LRVGLQMLSEPPLKTLSRKLSGASLETFSKIQGPQFVEYTQCPNFRVYSVNLENTPQNTKGRQTMESSFAGGATRGIARPGPGTAHENGQGAWTPCLLPAVECLGCKPPRARDSSLRSCATLTKWPHHLTVIVRGYHCSRGHSLRSEMARDRESWKCQFQLWHSELEKNIVIKLVYSSFSSCIVKTSQKSIQKSLETFARESLETSVQMYLETSVTSIRTDVSADCLPKSPETSLQASLETSARKSLETWVQSPLDATRIALAAPHGESSDAHSYPSTVAEI